MNKKKYNTRISFMNLARNGNFMSKVVDQELFDAVQAVEVGGRLVMKMMEAGTSKHHDGPWAILEYISKEDVDAFNNSRAPRTDNTSRKTGPSSVGANNPAAGNTDDVI